MKLKSLTISVLFVLVTTNLRGQNLNEYTFLGKVNLSDALLMARYTFEGEFPVLKNSSLIVNLGMHRKDYFYDDNDRTLVGYNLAVFVPGIFPTKRILGWHAGIGFRQYLKFEPDVPPALFFELKGTYRKSYFQEGFDVYVNLGSGNGGSRSHLVNGNQELYAIYFALGANTIFSKKKRNVDFSIGITQNFVRLNACRGGCSLPSWDNAPILNPDGSLPTRAQQQAFANQYYQPRKPFWGFRLELKFTFVKIKKA